MKAQPTYKTEAIILRAAEVKEYDRLYTIFSRERGKMQVLGIGTRKPKAKLASGLEPLTKSELFCVQGRSWDRVAGVIIAEQFPLIKASLEAVIEVKNIFRNLEDLLTQEEPCGEVYSALEQYLDRKEEGLKKENGDDCKIAALIVLWKAICNAGYRPQLHSCSLCSRKITKQKKYGLQVPEGVFCSSCLGNGISNQIQIDENTLKAWRFIMASKPQMGLKLAVPDEVKRQFSYLTKLFIQQISEKKARL